MLSRFELSPFGTLGKAVRANFCVFGEYYPSLLCKFDIEEGVTKIAARDDSAPTISALFKDTIMVVAACEVRLLKSHTLFENGGVIPVGVEAYFRLEHYIFKVGVLPEVCGTKICLAFEGGSTLVAIPSLEINLVFKYSFIKFGLTIK